MISNAIFESYKRGEWKFSLGQLDDADVGGVLGPEQTVVPAGANGRAKGAAA